MWITPEVKWLGDLRHEWAGLNLLVAVESVRQINGQSSTERRYYIASNPKATAQQAAASIRGHWGIENQLHWSLDMSFDEDASRKVGIKTKRLIAGWDHDYLLGLLTG